MRHSSTLLLLLFGFFSLTGFSDSRILLTQNQKINLINDLIFQNPLGENYSPRVLSDGEIENTNYGVNNPDLPGHSGCFDEDKNVLLHAGVDLYAPPGESAGGKPVKAAADGDVVYYNPEDEYPGQAVVLRHSGGIYSVYMHLRNVTVAVTEPITTVTRGTILGYVRGNILTRDQTNHYDWREENGYLDDSHLHFEIRNFEDASWAYQTYDEGVYRACDNSDKPGRGYTPSGVHPDIFPNSEQHYFDPLAFINFHQPIPTPTQTQTPTLTPTITETPMPTETPTVTPTHTPTVTPTLSSYNNYFVTGPYEFTVSNDNNNRGYYTLPFYQPDAKFAAEFFYASYGRSNPFDPREKDKSITHVLLGGGSLLSPAPPNWYCFSASGMTIPGTPCNAASIILDQADYYAGHPITWNSTGWPKQTDYAGYSIEALCDKPRCNEGEFPSITGTFIVYFVWQCWCPFDKSMGRCPPSDYNGQLVSNQPLNSLGGNIGRQIERAEVDAQTYYRVRDELLSSTYEGMRFIGLYNERGPDISILLGTHPDLLTRGADLLDHWQSKLQALLDGQGDSVFISLEEANAVDQYIYDMAYATGGPLRSILLTERTKMNFPSMAGLSMSQAWAKINAGPTPTPTVTATTTLSPTPTATKTPTGTSTPTKTSTPTPTRTQTRTPTTTISPTSTTTLSPTWTLTATFTPTPAPPDAFSKTGPVNGSLTLTHPALTWGASRGATSYEYCYDTSNNNICDAPWVSAGSSTNAVLSGLTNNATYYWQVRAVNAIGNTQADGNIWWSFTARTQTFADVPIDHSLWAYIEAFYNAGITGGCGVSPLIYCPEAPVTRSSMAVFLLKTKYGSGYSPPAASHFFADLPVAGQEWMEPWIDEFYRAGITTGCGTSPLIYCPNQAVTRAAMAVFILKAKYGSSYAPPAASHFFADLPVTGQEWMEPWIDQFYREGISTGCGVNPAIFCPANPVKRAAMAVFIVRAFNLPLQ
jgi:hypothetical protein